MILLNCLLVYFPQTESSHGGAAPAAVPLHRMAFTHLPFLERDPRVPAKSPVRRGDNHQGQQPGRTDARALQVRIHGHFRMISKVRIECKNIILIAFHNKRKTISFIVIV